LSERPLTAILRFAVKKQKRIPSQSASPAKGQDMANQRPSPDKYSEAIDELRRLARAPFETPKELLRLRHRITNERARTHRRILERIAKQAHVDLEPILEDARRRNAAKRRHVTKTLAKLEAQAAELAKTEKKHFHRIRSNYLSSFDGKPPLAAGGAELKFHQPIQWWGEARPGKCNQLFASWCHVDFGTYEATAEIAAPGDVGIWLYPYIYSDNGDCEAVLDAQTLQDLTYQMGPPTGSFLVNSIRVDLIGNGQATSIFGDPSGWFVEPDPLYEHTFVQMDVYIAQQINGAWQQWPLLSDKLFVGKGHYVRQIRSVLSGQTYPSGVVIRGPNVGGGDLLCHVQVVCSSGAIGCDGIVKIDCRAPDYGIFVGGVALIGEYV
jgi:hypothetical protein